MSASQYRGQLDRKRKQRIDAERKAGDYRSKETAKRTAAAKARAAANKATTSSTTTSKIREASVPTEKPLRRAQRQLGGRNGLAATPRKRRAFKAS